MWKMSFFFLWYVDDLQGLLHALNGDNTSQTRLLAHSCSLVELEFNLELNTLHEYVVVLESLKYVEKHIKSRTLATVSKSSRVLLSFLGF